MATRLLALLVITALGVYYIAFDVLSVHVLTQPYQVRVDLASAGGVYTDAAVTYRGVEVGKVGALHLHPNEVVADLEINHGIKIPANVTARVKELTAAAEQYMDLVPANADPPYLTAGSVIPMSRTSVPVSVGQLLDTVNALVESLHASDLNTISSSLAQGLQNAGPDLRSIITDSQTLLAALQQAVPGTVQAITAGNTVLQAAKNINADFATFTANLDLLSQQLSTSNSDLVQLLGNGAAASASLVQLLDSTAAATQGFIDGLSTVTGTAYQNNGAVQAMFQVLPVFANDIAATSTGGQIRFQLLFNDRNTVCPYTTQMLEPTTLVATADLTRSCTISAPDLLQRGASAAPPPAGG